jgi:hypothetical protein
MTRRSTLRERLAAPRGNCASAMEQNRNNHKGGRCAPGEQKAFDEIFLDNADDLIDALLVSAPSAATVKYPRSTQWARDRRAPTGLPPNRPAPWN